MERSKTSLVSDYVMVGLGSERLRRVNAFLLGPWEEKPQVGRWPSG